jgi:hypothetical protein
LFAIKKNFSLRVELEHPSYQIDFEANCRDEKSRGKTKIPIGIIVSGKLTCFE